jgi:hypothetical protein
MSYNGSAVKSYNATNSVAFMCKEMPVIPVNKVVDRNNNRKKMRAKEEERHKGSLTPPKNLIA